MLGDLYVMNSATCEFAAIKPDGTKDGDTEIDLSAAIQKVQLSFENHVTDAEYTFGHNGRRRGISNKYDCTINITFYVDGFGGSTLDGTWTAFLPPPFGSGTGRVGFTFSPASGDVSATNPAFSGILVASTWEPFGDGEAGGIIQQTRTFMTDGDILRKTS